MSKAMKEQIYRTLEDECNVPVYMTGRYVILDIPTKEQAYEVADKIEQTVGKTAKTKYVSFEPCLTGGVIAKRVGGYMLIEFSSKEKYVFWIKEVA